MTTPKPMPTMEEGLQELHKAVIDLKAAPVFAKLEPAERAVGYALITLVRMADRIQKLETAAKAKEQQP